MILLLVLVDKEILDKQDFKYTLSQLAKDTNSDNDSISNCMKELELQELIKKEQNPIFFKIEFSDLFKKLKFKFL